MDSPIQLTTNDYVYRRLNPKQWSGSEGKEWAVMEGFTLRREQGEEELSLYIARLKTPLQVLQQSIDSNNQKINDPTCSEGVKERARLFLKGKPDVDAFIKKRWRVAELPFSVFIGKKCLFKLEVDENNIGHIEVEFAEADEENYALDWAGQARVLSTVQCGDPTPLPEPKILIQKIALPRELNVVWR